MMEPAPHEVTQLLRAGRTPLVYKELDRAAWRYMAQEEPGGGATLFWGAKRRRDG